MAFLTGSVHSMFNVIRSCASIPNTMISFGSSSGYSSSASFRVVKRSTPWLLWITGGSSLWCMFILNTVPGSAPVFMASMMYARS